MRKTIVNSKRKQELPEENEKTATHHEIRTESESFAKDPSAKRISKNRENDEDEYTDDRGGPRNLEESQSYDSYRHRLCTAVTIRELHSC